MLSPALPPSAVEGRGAQLLDRARESVTPARRSWAERLPGATGRLAGYHLGRLDEHGAAVTGASIGKAFRPALVFSSAKAMGGSAEDALPAAGAVEPVRNISPVHDDVIDGDELRRHRPTVWAVFGIPAALLGGDTVPALTLRVLADVPGRRRGTGGRGPVRGDPRCFSPKALRALPADRLDTLAAQIRAFLTDKVTKVGGHLGPNLGVVELTLALHRVFTPPRDVPVFDTGHQAYVHKLLTGRQAGFDQLRQAGGLSGYPSRAESAHDLVENSHASTALSWADGLAKARHLHGETDRAVVAVVGDGALTGGMCFEALNNLGAARDRPVIVVLNDNGRSCAATTGALATHLTTLRDDAGKGAACRNIFTDLGFTYLGPLDGHDTEALESVLRRARDLDRPVVVHVVTTKGKGYLPAETGAGLLQVTDRILTAGDLCEALSPLAPEENRTRSGIPPTRHLIWDKNFKKQRSACSERFQLAADTIVPTFRRTGKGGLRLPSTGVGLRPEHIPRVLAPRPRRTPPRLPLGHHTQDAQTRGLGLPRLARAAAAWTKLPSSSGSTPRTRGSATRSC